jgi:high-affinity K+ transport system ATPase subunit B
VPSAPCPSHWCRRRPCARLTIIFLLATATLLPYSIYSVQTAGQGTPVTVTVLVALLVCLIPTTIGALLSAVIFNALIIVALIPLALRGVRYRSIGASALLRRHLWIYGVGGIIIPFIGIKTIDVLLVALGLA